MVADGRELDVDGDGFFLGVRHRRRHARDGLLPGRDLRPGALRGSVDTYDEALGLVNNPYGNGTAIFTRDGGVARQFQFSRGNAGMVGVNVPIPVPVAYYSFSGTGRHRCSATRTYGPESIHLHARQGRHELGRPGHQPGRPGLPPDAVTSDGEAGRDPSRGRIPPAPRRKPRPTNIRRLGLRRLDRLASSRPSSATEISRILNFWILPVTVMGKPSVNRQ